jgi:hypothetical protein
MSRTQLDQRHLIALNPVREQGPGLHSILVLSESAAIVAPRRAAAAGHWYGKQLAASVVFVPFACWRHLGDLFLSPRVRRASGSTYGTFHTGIIIIKLVSIPNLKDSAASRMPRSEQGMQLCGLTTTWHHFCPTASEFRSSGPSAYNLNVMVLRLARAQFATMSALTALVAPSSFLADFTQAPRAPTVDVSFLRMF